MTCKKYSVFLSLLFLLGCGSKKESQSDTSLIGTWRLSDVAPIATNNPRASSFVEEAELKLKLQAGQLLSLYPDNSFTILAGADVYETGKWKLKSQQNILELGNEASIKPGKFSIETNQEGRVILSMQDKNATLVNLFVKEPSAAQKYSEDPYHSSNNWWRIKPATEETDDQILKRFLNYFQHVALILKLAKEKKLPTVSFEFSKGPVRIYSGGIGIYPYSIVPDTWKNCFFNDRAALKACIMFENYLAGSSYRGASTGSWVEDDYNIMLAVYAGMSKAIVTQKQ